jgi:hypothetical protein
MRGTTLYLVTVAVFVAIVFVVLAVRLWRGDDLYHGHDNYYDRYLRRR